MTTQDGYAIAALAPLFIILILLLAGRGRVRRIVVGRGRIVLETDTTSAQPTKPADGPQSASSVASEKTSKPVPDIKIPEPPNPPRSYSPDPSEEPPKRQTSTSRQTKQDRQEFMSKPYQEEFITTLQMAVRQNDVLIVQDHTLKNGKAKSDD